MFEDENCAGPCERSLLDEQVLPSTPTVTWRRGQNVRIKYRRNNHIPGGFIRLSIVQKKHMMSHAKHDEGAFHHSCWGAEIIVASEKDFKEFEEDDELRVSNV